MATTEQQALIQALQNPACYNHAVTQLTMMETHISWVILTGEYAYKIKKGVDFGFLDYSSLEKRHSQCEAELRLNRRTSPQLYLDVVPIGGSASAPQLFQQPAIEYAVKMRQFPQTALLSRLLSEGKLTEDNILGLADQIATFHSQVDVAADDSSYGTPDRVFYPVNENFEQIRALINDDHVQQRLDVLEQHNRRFFEQHREHFKQRKQNGFIRDCHGDLHLNNILLLEGEPMLFDCIEFNPNLRIIDVINEMAFLVMDLELNQRADLANLLLNRYLERNGDYEGLRLMPFYLGYRAMVRAKVALLGLDPKQQDDEQQRAIMDTFLSYLALAEKYAQPAKPQLLITHGLSGSGKTTVSEQLLNEPGVIRLRSDVERKRLFGLDSKDNSQSAPGKGLYTREASRRTYDYLLQLGEAALSGGYTVIVDATFLQQEERLRFRQLAERLHIPFTLLHFQADTDTLQQRVQQRLQQGTDASEADTMVLQQQLEYYTRPGEDEAITQLILNTHDAGCAQRIKVHIQGQQ